MSNIVIVDDRSINRTIYAKLAQSIGPEIEVRDFANPEDALDWLALNRADLVITDQDMPQIEGDEFITRFRTLPHAPRVPVMMITVNDQRMLRLRALESGANDFLHSPIDHCEFVMRARNLLKLAQAMTRADPDPVAPIAPLEPLPLRKEQQAAWGFSPRLDLINGRVAGAQLFRDGRPADLGDPEATRILLETAAALQAGGRGPVSLTLTARLDGDGDAPAAKKLGDRLAEAGLEPHWLDLRLEAAEILAAPRQAEWEAQAFSLLGVGLTLQLGTLSSGAGRTGKLAPPLEQFIENWGPSIAFACPEAPADALRLARRLGRRARPVHLIAEAVGSAALLKALRRAGAREAQGACFGAPFAARDLTNLFPPAETDARKRSA